MGTSEATRYPIDRLSRQIESNQMILGFTRYLSAVYVFSLLHLLVHIQLHLIGGQSYEQARIKATMEVKGGYVIQHYTFIKTDGRVGNTSRNKRQ